MANTEPGAGSRLSRGGARRGLAGLGRGLLAAAGLLAPLSGQDQAVVPADAEFRAKALGELRTADGEPWVGAEVLLESHPLPDWPGAGSLDRQRTVTDQRGRFRVPVLRHRRYLVWASQGRRVSAVATGVVAGVPVLLKEAGPVPARRIQVQGLAAWPGHAPFRARVVLADPPGHGIPVALPVAGGFDLPAVPGRSCEIEILDKDGLPRQVATVELTGPGGAGPLTIAMPEPKPVFLAVRDIGTEKGLAGATIRYAHHGDLVALGKTDQDGLVRLCLPVKVDRHPPTLFAEAPGFAVAPLQGGDAAQVKAGGWGALRDGIEVAWHANLNKGLRFKGRILLGPGRPAAGLTLFVRGQGMHFNQRNSRNVGVYRRLVQTAADGRFHLDGCLPEDYWRAELGLLLAPAHLAQLPAAWRRSLQPVLADLAPLAAGKPDEVNDLGDIDLQAWAPVRVAVVDPNGQPAGFAQVAVSSGAPAGSGGSLPWFSASGRDGCLLLLAKAGEDNVLAVRRGAQIATYRLSVQRIAGDTRPAELRVALPSAVTVSGTARDANGKPVTGVTLHVVASSRVNQPGFGAVEELVEEHRPNRNSACLRPLDPAVGQRLLRGLLPFRRDVETDGKGGFRFEVPAVPAQYTISADWQGHRLLERIAVGEGPVAAVELVFGQQFVPRQGGR